MAGLGLENFSDDLGSVANGDINSLPSNIYGSFARYAQDHLVPLLIGIAITATILYTFYGAYLYFTAFGDEQKAAQAKKSITYAIVGFVISLLAFSIASYTTRILIRKDADNFQTQISAPSTAPPVGGSTH